MNISCRKPEPNKMELDFMDMRPGEAQTLGSYLRRSLICNDSGYGVIAVSLSVDGVNCNTPFQVIDGLTEDIFYVLQSLRSLTIRSVKPPTPGTVVKLVYSGNALTIFPKDLKCSDPSLIKVELPSDSYKPLLNNVCKKDIHLEALVCWSEGNKNMVDNEIIIDKNSLDPGKYLISDSMHPKITKIGMEIQEHNYTDDLFLKVDFLCGDSSFEIKKVLDILTNQISSLKSKL